MTTKYITFEHDNIKLRVETSYLYTIDPHTSDGTFDAYLKETCTLINNATEKLDNREQLLKDLYELTWFIGHNWNITSLVNKYKLIPFDIFYVLVHSQPFGVGQYNYNDDRMSDENIKKVYLDELRQVKKYAHFDYWNGIPIKNSFPSYAENDNFDLRIKKYNDRNNDIGYQVIFDLINRQMNGQYQSIVSIDEIDEICRPNVVNKTCYQKMMQFFNNLKSSYYSLFDS